MMLQEKSTWRYSEIEKEIDITKRNWKVILQSFKLIEEIDNLDVEDKHYREKETGFRW